jgi:hypothetical protein
MYQCKLPFPENWETQLETALLQDRGQAHAEKAYVCSPCSAETWSGVQLNMLAARAYMYAARLHLQMTAIAPHAYMPVMFDDNDPVERRTALNIGSNFLNNCTALYVCGNRISRGMKGEIRQAAKLRIPIVLFNTDIAGEVCKILAGIRGAKRRLILNTRCSELGMSARDLFEYTARCTDVLPTALFERKEK